MGLLSVKVAFGQTVFDSFTDGNFTASPVWGGTTATYGIVANSDVAAGATGSNTVRLAAAAAGTQYLSSQISTWGGSQTWRFFLGRRANAATSTNNSIYWLYANESNLTSATVDGYRINFGDNTGGDELFLEYVVNGAVSATVVTSAAVTNGLTDIGILVRVTRSSAGLWTLFTSTLPTANGGGAIASDIPSDANTSVNQGSATNNTLPPAANGYIGFVNANTAGASALIAAEWDQIYFDQVTSGGPTITFTPSSLSTFTATFPSAGGALTSTITGSSLTPASGSITVNAPTNFQVSKDGSSWGTSANFDYTGGNTFNAANSTVHFRIAAGTPSGPVSGSATSSGGGVTTPPSISLSGTVVGPLITVTGGSPFNKFHANAGQVSDGQLIVVSGSALGPDQITVGPLTDYEFSTDVNFSSVNSSIILTPVAGTVAATNVYIRMAVAAPGNYNGTLNITSPNATTVTRSVTGQRYPAPVPFAAGNLIALRLGDGTLALSNAAQPVFLDEYTPGGSLVQSVAMPMTNDGTNRRFCISGTSTSDGVMNLSPDGKFLTLSGYNATNIYQASIIGTSTPAVQRLVATVDFEGNINTSTRLNAYSGNNIRGAVTVNGTGFWTTGPGATPGNICYVPGGNDGTGVVNLNNTWNSRSVKISNSSLYISRQAEIGRVAGPPLPTLAGTGTPTTLPGISGLANCWNFVVLDVDPTVTGDDLIYISDGTNGILKFSKNISNVWTARGSRPGGLGADNTSSITANVNGPNDIEIFVNHAYAAAGNTIYRIVDNANFDANITSSGTNYSLPGNLVATAATNTIFRSVAFAPIFVPTPEIEHTFTTPGGVGNIAQGSTTNALVRAQLDITSSNGLLTGATFTTAGSYAASDFINFRLVLSNDATLDAGDVTLGTINSVGGPGQVLNFTGLGQLLPINTTRYLFLAPTVNGCAATFATINVGTVTTANISYGDLSTIATGTSFSTETKTISAGLPNDVSGFSLNQNIQVFFTPTGCFSEVVVVAHTAPITGTPSGTYTGNLNYGAAPAFPGGGRVVYVGGASPQLISGLTVGTNYFFKVFVREGTRYSQGVESSVVHQREFLYSRGSGLSHTDAIWSLSSNGTGQTLAALGGLQQFRGIRIQNGHSVQLSASGPAVVARELVVDAGGTFTATGTTPGDNKFLIVYGNVTNDGTIGTGTTFNPICFSIEGASTTFQGFGVTNVSRIRKGDISNTAISDLIINQNVNVRFPDLGGVWVNVGGGRLNVTINSGKTLNIADPAGSFSIDGVDGLGSGERHGSVTVNGTLVVAGTLYIKNNNTTPGNNVNYSVGAGGLIDANDVIGDFSPAGFNPSFINFISGGKLAVRSALIIQSGTLSSGIPGGLVLKSTASGTARIASTTGSISGNITAERYIPTSGWHFTGTALAGQTIADWNDDISTQGPMPGVATPNTGYYTSSIFAYDQTNNDVIPYHGNTTNGWVVPTSSAINQNQGYRVFISSGKTLDNTGTYTTGTKTLTLSSTGGQTYQGYNLVVNPHLSAINRSGFTFGGGVQNTILVWDPTAAAGAGRYRYEGSVVTSPITIAGGPSPIASGQGFFLFTTINGSTVDIPESAKASTNGTFFRTNTGVEGLALRISNGQGNQDHTVFQFMPDALSGYEPLYDAQKMLNPDMSLYTLTSDLSKLAINALPFEGSQMVIPVGYKAAPGAYVLDLVGIQNLSAAQSVYLKDNETGTISDLSQNATYAFVSSSEGENNGRFELIFTQSVTQLADMKKAIKPAVTVYPNPVKDQFFTVGMTNLTGKVNIQLTDILGKVVYAQSFDNVSDLKEVKLTRPSVSGHYILKVNGKDGNFVQSVVIP
jgi:hypothetical protein